MAKGSGLTAYFLPNEAVFRTFASSVRMRMEGANPGTLVEGAGRLTGRVSFLAGAEENWRTGLPIYGAVAYRGLYKGIDMVYGGSGRNLKSEFVVAPGADPSRIRVRYIGAGEIRIDGDGALVIPLNGEVLREQAPELYQNRGGKRVAVEGRFQVGADGAIGFAIGEYDCSLPLVIDPVISYSTFLGGSGADAANALAVDSTGAVYVAGFTESYNFPTLNPVQAANAGGNDVFVAKLNPAGNALVYATYLGGRGDDRAFGIAVDSTGAAYVTGWTQSANFPVRNAMQASLAGGQNAFLVKLTPTGNGLAYSTYLGGNGSDSGNGIAVDSGGNAYVAGDTTSANFPVSGFQKTYHGGQDVFVAKLNPSWRSLVYSTYLGGGNFDHGAGIAVDSSGTAYITGSTTSTDFPVANAFQGINGGGQNAFVTRLSADGKSLLFSTFLGGSGGRTGYPEAGQGIAIDSSGNAYVTGVTSSTNFPLMNPAQSTLNGSSDAFIAKMSATGSLVYSTYLGGSGIDSGNAIAVDSSGNAYFAGYTYSIDLPVLSAVQPAIGSIGSTDAFVGKLSAAGNSLSFLTYLGGNDSDTATGVAVDASGSVYVVGWTLSANFPVANAYQTSNAGNYGAFVTKYVFSVGPVNVGVTPSSGSGSAQTFSFQYSDSNGTSDLTAVAALFSTSSSLTGACAVIYNRAQNTLALLTDTGAQPASPMAPGSGTQQNSQCVLNGGGSSVSLSGNLLTLNLAITFAGAFSGAKNVYMQSSNPYQITAWQPEGTWSAPASIATAVTPSSGSATQQTFSLVVTDPLGVVADLTSAGVLFNSSTGIAGACSVIYNRTLNTLALTTDSGGQPAGSITPGSGTQQNSQCVLNGAGSSVSVAGNALTVNLALSFQPAFGGSKNVYMDAVSKNGALGWTQEGTWTSPPVVTMSVSPSSGSANQQTFSLQVSDSTGAADLTVIGALWNTTAATVSGCAIVYNHAQNALTLLTDAGAQPAGSIAPGSGTQQNSQCVLNGAGSSVSVSGDILTLNLAVTFQPVFSGAKNVYLEASNPYETVNWLLEGTWTSPPAVTMAVTPSSGAGTQQTFTLQVTDSLAAADLTSIGVLFNSTASVAGACSVAYNRAQNTLALLTDAGTLPAGTIAPGSGTQQNSQCVLSGSGSSVSSAGNTLTLSLSLTFEPAFTGTKNVYMDATSPSETVAWQSEGVWVSAAAPGILVTPSSGSATQQTFSLQVTDPLGAGDLVTLGLLFNSTASMVNACAVTYNRAQNTLMLLTDSGTQPTASITPGNGTQQNRQCVLNGVGSSVSASGNLLTVNLAIGFQPAFSGTTNLYAEAVGATQTLNWQQEGTWTAPPVVTMAVTPLSGSGTQQSFTLQVTDSLSGSDLTAVGLLINSTTATAGACSVTYNSAHNTLALLTDAGTAPASTIAPGSGTQQNSQCMLNGSASSVSVSGTTLTLSLTIAFQPAFTGSKNVYIEAANSYETVNWQLEGVWVVPSALVMSVTPSSGAATQQIFNLQVTDPAGASDLTTVGLLFNSTVSTAGACVVLYSRTQNTLMLLTDTGAQPAGSIAPGSGTQQNSQCVLNGAGSSASVGGNVLSLNVSISFPPAFTGTKNLYVEAIGVAQSLSWQQEGIWALPQILTLAVTPSSGTATQQTFSLQVSDSLAAADITTVGILFNTSSSATGACAVTYNRAQNALTLLTDSGVAPASSITPGSGSQQNSQCTLSGSGSTVTTSGNTLTANLAVTFQSAFSGAKNLYVEAGSSFQAANWTLAGTWTSPPVVAMSMSPSSGGGPQQLFTFQVSDSLAATDLTTVGVLFNTSVSAVSACTVMYNRAQNALTLLTDAGAAPAGSIAPGSGSQQNSQCTLNGAGSSVTTSGSTLTLNLSLSFQASWVGAKTVYMEAVNPYQSGTWLTEGRWVTSASLTLSESPSSGSGTQATFTVQASDSWGATDVAAMGILFNTTTSLAGACAVTYNWAQNTLALLTDAGLAPASSIVPGSGTQQNSQCTLNGAGSSATVAGLVMTLNVSITFQPAFAGTKNAYVEASDPFHAASWTSEGVWVVPQGVGLSVTPSSGSATQQTFTLQISDALGEADLTTVGILFNTSSSATGACAVTYNRSQNALTLLTDTGTAPAGSIAPGSGSQQNSQCTLSGSGSSVTTSGNTLTLNLAIAFQPAFSGAKNLYLEAGSSFQAANWTLEGAWTPAPLVTMSMSPSSGGGPQQLFTFQVSDSLAATDLTTVGVLFNTSVSAVSACTVMYNRAQNALTLLTDAGAAPAGSIAPGSGSQQNSQCTLNGAGSSVTTSGSTLTLNLSLSFQASWVGAKTVYMEAVNPYQSGTWLTEGRWVTSASLTLSESPSSGSGTQATFTVQASDSWGATDVAAMGILFNTTTSLAGACAVTYNWAQNTLALLTDAGLAPASSIVPGSGTQQNSQCTLNGSGSSVTVAGLVMTLNVSIAFQPAFAGTQNVYVEASDPFHAASWISEGTWTAPLAASLTELTLPGIAMTASPAVGSGSRQTFRFQFSGNGGAAALSTAGVLIGTAASTSGACAIVYNQAQNSLTLLTDSGAQPASSIAPGSGSQQNSQCTLDGAASSVSISGSNLQLNLSLNFPAAFYGVKRMYMKAANSSTAVDWQSAGSWTVAPNGASAVGVTPASGAGNRQVFSFRYSDTAGTGDLSTVFAWFMSPSDFFGFTNSCIAYYNSSLNLLYLSADGAFWQAPVKPGSPGVLSNSQCSIDAGASGVTASGNDLILSLAMTFASSYSGGKNLFMRSDSSSGASSGWSNNGTWTALSQTLGSGASPIAPQAPAAVSVVPLSGAGYGQTFDLQYFDAAGAADLSTVWVSFAPDSARAFATIGCTAYYSQQQNLLYLVTDENDYIQSAAPGAPAVLRNGQCSIDAAAARVTASATNLTLVLPVTFTSAYAGSKSVYMNEVSADGTSAGWTMRGSWSVPQERLPPPVQR